LEATIKALEGEVLRLRNPADMRQFIELNGRTGIMRSNNYDDGEQGEEVSEGDEHEKTGWLIDAQGNTYFNNGSFNNCSFTGAIDANRLEAGPLIVHPDQPSTRNWNFGSNATADTIFNFLKVTGIFDGSGYYSNVSNPVHNLTGLRITRTTVTDTSNRDVKLRGETRTTIIHHIRGTTQTEIARSVQFTPIHISSNNPVKNDHTRRTNAHLFFSASAGSMTMELINLPECPAATPTKSNTVYKEADGNGNFFLKVKS